MNKDIKELLDRLTNAKSNAIDEENRELATKYYNAIKEIQERHDIAIRLLHKLFGTDDYEINYIIGIINGQRQIKFDNLEREMLNE